MDSKRLHRKRKKKARNSGSSDPPIPPSLYRFVLMHRTLGDSDGSGPGPWQQLGKTQKNCWLAPKLESQASHEFALQVRVSPYLNLIVAA